MPKKTWTIEPQSSCGRGMDVYFQGPKTSPCRIDSVSLHVTLDPHENIDIPKVFERIMITHRGEVIEVFHGSILELLAQRYGSKICANDGIITLQLPTMFDSLTGGCGLDVESVDEISIYWSNRMPSDVQLSCLSAKVIIESTIHDPLQRQFRSMTYIANHQSPTSIPIDIPENYQLCEMGVKIEFSEQVQNIHVMLRSQEVTIKHECRDALWLKNPLILSEHVHFKPTKLELLVQRSPNVSKIHVVTLVERLM